jgi:hypothetical protein
MTETKKREPEIAGWSGSRRFLKSFLFFASFVDYTHTICKRRIVG